MYKRKTKDIELCCKLYKETRYKCSGGAYFDKTKERYVQYWLTDKALKRYCGKKIRHILNNNYINAGGCSYKKYADYKWLLY